MTEIKKSSKRVYTSPYKKQKNAFNFDLTERDVRILRAVNHYRYLRVEQIKRLEFVTNSSKQSCQKRLKYLYHGGFLERIVPFVQIGNGGESTAYYLGKNGAELLAANGETIYSYTKSGQVKHMFLNHALDLSEFRINLEFALRDYPNMYLAQFVCDFEIKSHLNKTAGMAKFKLWTQLNHPTTRQKYVVYPDAKIVLKIHDKEVQALYFLEIDRGTESLNVIRDKVIGYDLYRKEKIFQKFGRFKGFRVLFQAHSKKRAQNMRKALTNLEGADLVWITAVSEVNENTLLKSPIWINDQGETRSILKSSK